ncbi:MAG: dTMP kinase [Alphaproteobacteria bacterium]|nr:dTMP kinase [Alphaproteobacteria bacterium]
MVDRSKAKFISFEGGEGAGKSTQIQRLAVYIESCGIQVCTTREPGGSVGAEEIRDLLVEGDVDRWDSTTETLLLAAARRSHMGDLITPALENGDWVLCDRFIDSTKAYQGYGQGLDLAVIAQLQEIAVGNFIPDLTILLDISVEDGLARAASRGGAARYEQMDISMHLRIREGFLKMAAAEPDRFVIVDAGQSIDAVSVEIKNCIAGRFGLN